MGKTKHRLAVILLSACFALSGLGLTGLAHKTALAEESSNALNEKLIVQYSMDDTDTGAGKKLAAYKWDASTQALVRNEAADATVQNNVNGANTGTVTSTDGLEGSGALAFTGKAHARANFNLPSDATGMTVSMLVKNINAYWSSLIEFWDGTNGGRLGKGTMQGNGGRSNEGDPWSSNCPAHDYATGAWDAFVIDVGSSDKGSTAVDPMKADTWYQVTFVLTATEMRAYRDGELKQVFDGSVAPSNPAWGRVSPTTILQSIMTAVKSGRGQLGIRLCHDASNGDILDDVRIYNGALTEEEVKASIHPFIAAAPEYYDVEGLGYPTELLLDGAETVTDGTDSQKTGVTGKGVTYTYTPLTLGVNDTTPANDEKGIKVTLNYNSASRVATVKFRRTLKLEAESLGYKIGSGEAVAIDGPYDAGKDIIVKVDKGTNLSNVTAGTLAVKKLHADSDANKYTTQFKYSASTHTALVRCSYAGYSQFDTVYTIKFVEKNAETFTSLTVTGGKSDVKLSIADFTENSANIAVNDLTSFTLNLTLSLAEGATLTGGGNTKTFTAADLNNGKLSFTVVNENGDEVEYFLVPVALSSDTSLTLTASGYELQGSGNAYTVTINKGEVAKLIAAITATPTSEKATVVKSYDAAASKIIITVMAEDGVTIQQYIITVTEQDTDATLSEIKVGGVALAGFDPATTEYTYQYKGTIPNVTATAASATAQQPVVSAVVENKVTITVTAENGDTKVYTVTFVLMRSGATLNKVTLNGKVLTADDFVENAAAYEAPAGTQLNTISVITEVSAGATAAYTLNGNQLIITVTSEDGETTTTYTVTITVAAATLPTGGVTEDNSPEISGCGSSVSGTAIAVTMFVLAVGVGLFVKKTRKTH